MSLGNSWNKSSTALLCKAVRDKLRLKKGISLLEVTIALAILTIGVIYLMTVFPFGLNAARNSEQSTRAAFLAQAKIEEVISAIYGDVATGQGREPSLAALDQDFAGFSRQTTANYVDEHLAASADDEGLKKVVVEVFWQDALKHATSSVSLITLIADY